MFTLHLYLARELLKTFVMTGIALTLLIVMGGGVANLFRGEGVGADEMAKIFLFLTPVAVTLVLPVAALFSAAITYGRAAADNEILACRAVGINIHRLLLSAALLGVLVTTFTYWSWNFMIPNLSKQIKDLSRQDLLSIVKGEFDKAKHLSFGKFRLMADNCSMLDPEDVSQDLPEGHQYLRLTGVSFIEVEDDEPIRYGTADETIIDFDNSESTPRVTVDLQSVRSFDSLRWQEYELKHQVLGPFSIPMPVRYRTKFENLERLRYYTRNPEAIPEVEDRLFGLKRDMLLHFLANDIKGTLANVPAYVLTSPKTRFEISALYSRTDQYDGRPELSQVTVIETRGAEKRSMSANLAKFELKSSLDRHNPVIVVELSGQVEIKSLPFREGGRIVRKERESLDPVHVMDQPGLRDKIKAFDFLTLLDTDYQMALPKRQTHLRDKLIKRLAKFKAEVRGEIHFRASYSLCSIAVVLFGAILGIIVRGGQVLTAFGISCVPMVFVVVASIVGRNLADRPDYALLSVTVMWGSALFMYLVTGVVAMRILKR